MRRMKTAMPAATAHKGRRNTSGRTRARRKWRRIATILVVSLTLLLVIAAASGGVWAVQSGAASTLVERLQSAVLDMTVEAGLTIEEILVVGRRETKRSNLVSAIDARRGDPILGFDPSTARQRILDLGWIADASVERRLPGTILVRLVERKPIAIWQRNGQFALVDGDGIVIGDSNVGDRRDLTLIVGAEAPRHALTLLAMLHTHPQLMDRVAAAIRVADRRWNLRFDNDIDVRLPEENPQAAWDRLAELQAQHKLLERDIIAIDLRVPERLVVRMRPAAATRLRTPGGHT